MKIFKFLTILALGANALTEREQRRQARREEIERDGELGEEDAKVSSILGGRTLKKRCRFPYLDNAIFQPSKTKLV